MPKQKTRRSAAKRFSATAGGLLVRGKANHNHLLEHKSASRKRRISGNTSVSKADAARVRRLAGL